MKRTDLLGMAGAVVASIVLSACHSTVQTTSGSNYLSRYQADADAIGGGRMDSDIRRAANVEPVLTFPARIGVARIDIGGLSPIPEVEAEAWFELAEKLGPSWGEFVPVSPLVVALATSDVTSGSGLGRCDISRAGCAVDVVKAIRLGAARQHLDVVLIYEVRSRGEISNNPLAFANYTIIGLYVFPTRNVEAEGTAQALLVDVRNGYTYGSASAVTEDPAFTLSTWANDREAQADVENEAKTAAVLELIPEVETMAVELRQDLLAARPALEEKAAQQPKTDTATLSWPQ